MKKRGFLAGLVAGFAALATVLVIAAPVMADYPTVDTSQAGRERSSARTRWLHFQAESLR